MLTQCLGCGLPFGVVKERARGLCNRCYREADEATRIVAGVWRKWERKHENPYQKALERIVKVIGVETVCYYLQCERMTVTQAMNRVKPLEAEHNEQIRWLLAALPTWQWASGHTPRKW